MTILKRILSWWNKPIIREKPVVRENRTVESTGKPPEYPIGLARKATLSEAVTEFKPKPDIPKWLLLARKNIGQSEVKGKKHNPVIVGWWKKIGSHFRDDETPYCAAFVGAMLEDAGIKSTRSAAARSYEKWGIKLDNPVVGCVVVLWRGNPKGWSGHVGFFEGYDKMGNIMVLGANQSDTTSIAPFNPKRLLSYRWAEAYPLPSNSNIPVLASNCKQSTNEA